MKRILFSLLILAGANLNAQQLQQSNTYGYNLYSLNPAFAGASGCTEVNFSHLNQWVKIEGAPVTSTLSANTRFGKELGVGGQIFVDKIGMLRQVSGLASVAYGYRFLKEHYVRAGVSFGYNQYRLDPSSAVVFDPNDPIVNGGVQSAGTVNTEFGITYQWKNLQLGWATKQLIQAYSNFGYTNLNGYGLRRHSNFFASYNYIINPTWTVRPSILAKGTNNGYQMDINADAVYKNLIFGGLGYRTKVGLIARVGVNIQNMFFLGYAYETPMSNIASYSAGSHEVIIGLKFCKKQKEKQPELTKTTPKDSMNLKPRVDTVLITKVDTVYIEKVVERIVEKTVPVENNNTTTGNSEVAIKNREKLYKPILFIFDKTIVQPNSVADLEAVLQSLKEHPNLKVELEGHTDSKGENNYNDKLSKDRVNAVRNYLIKNGVDKSRIKIKYFGEGRPVETNDSAQGRRQNRRVDVRFIE